MPAEIQRLPIFLYRCTAPAVTPLVVVSGEPMASQLDVISRLSPYAEFGLLKISSSVPSQLSRIKS